MIYLDNAATTWPKPEQVYREMDRFFRHSAANPGRSGHRMALASEDAIARTRLALARLFNVADPSRIVFSANATDALNLALKGLLGPGDHVITSTMEHNSVLRPLKSLEGRGVTVTKVAALPDGWIEPEAIAKAVTPRTRMIVAAHVSNVTGTIEPIAAIGELARQKGLLFLVDGAQSAGTLAVDLAALPVDLFAFTGHKGLFGPPGTGGLYIGGHVDLRYFETAREGGTGIHSEESRQPSELPQRFEAGTPNTVGIVGLGAGVEFLLETGMEEVHRLEAVLMRRLVAGLRGIPGITIYGPADHQDRGAAVSFNLEGWRPADVGAILDQHFEIACRTGLHCAPEACQTIGAFPLGTVRISLSLFNSEDEVAAVLEALSRITAAQAL
ncbi:MAG: aminotransferase class V-fold PLP-dependent enzyme [Syntrophaceae bacterium]|nr:aminotransferase class V-fold PLP-dependent enzyme [Syntrophaceae bacterium]